MPLAREDGRSTRTSHTCQIPNGSPGLWGEVAVDGFVLFERGLRLSSALAEVRRQIAAGRIVRRFARGQSYWVDLRGNPLASRGNAEPRASRRSRSPRAGPPARDRRAVRGEELADVVRESQEALELALKGLLRACGIDPAHSRRFRRATGGAGTASRSGSRRRRALAAASRDLRRDRELAFYGAEDRPRPRSTARRRRARARSGADGPSGRSAVVRE